MKLRWMVAALVLAACAAPPAAWSADEHDDTDSQLLSNDYRDESQLLKFAPPAAVRIIQRGGLGMEIVSFVHDTKQWGGNVQVVVLGQGATPEEFMRQSARTLAQSFKGVQVLDARELTISGHKAARQLAALEAEATESGTPAAARSGAAKIKVTLIRQMLAVQLEPTKYMVLNLYSPSSTQADAVRTFEAMVKRFEVLDPKVVAQQRKEAIDEGKAWLKEQRAEMLTDRLLREPRFFAMKVDGRDVGYLRMVEGEGVREGYTGVLVNVNSCTFPPDGSMISSEAECFWAYRDTPYKGQSDAAKRPKDPVYYSYWAMGTKNFYRVSLPPTGAVQLAQTWANEMGTMALSFSVVNEGKEPRLGDDGQPLKDKNGNILYKTRIGAATPENTETRVYVVRTADRRLEPALNRTFENKIAPGTYAVLPKALEYLWPRLVDLSKPARYAFVVSNVQTRTGVGLRTLCVHARQNITVEGKSVSATRLTDELDPGTTTLWVDATGKVLTMRTSDGTTLTPTTEEAMLRAWRTKIDTLMALPKAPTNPTVIDAGGNGATILPRSRGQ